MGSQKAASRSKVRKYAEAAARQSDGSGISATQAFPRPCNACEGEGTTASVFDIAAGKPGPPCTGCNGLGWVHIYPGDRCPFIPGSEGKIKYVEARYLAGCPLWDERDATYGSNSELAEKKERAERMNSFERVFGQTLDVMAAEENGELEADEPEDF